MKQNGIAISAVNKTMKCVLKIMQFLGALVLLAIVLLGIWGALWSMYDAVFKREFYHEEKPPSSTANIAEKNQSMNDGDTKTMGFERCEVLTDKMIRTLENGLSVTGGQLVVGSASAVKSKDFKNVYFIAAEVNGPGLDENSDIGVWSSNSLSPGAGMIFSVNGIATEFSAWPNGTKAKINQFDDGAQEVVKCVKKSSEWRSFIPDMIPPIDSGEESVVGVTTSIPGIIPVDIYGNLTNKGFIKTGPQSLGDGKDRIVYWSLDKDSQSQKLKVEVFGRTDMDVYKVVATPLTFNNDFDTARQFLVYVASVPYINSEPQKAKQWIEEHYSEYGAQSTVIIGGVELSLFGPKRARQLEIYIPLKPKVNMELL